MKATEFFNMDMTSSEARIKFFEKYRECETAKELDELKAAYRAIASVITRREIEDAMIRNIMS